MPHRHALILLALIVTGMLAGIAGGWFWGPAMLKISWLGDLFLNSLKMLIVPLILSAVISGIASLGDVRKLGNIGIASLGYYVATTAIAVFIGLVVVNLIQPGAGLELTAGSSELPQKVLGKEAPGMADVILSLVSPNLTREAANNNLLPLIVFAILFSAALTTLGDAGKPVISFFEGINDAMMKLVIWIMYFSPLGIFALVATQLGKAGGGEEFMLQIMAAGILSRSLADSPSISSSCFWFFASSPVDVRSI